MFEKIIKIFSKEYRKETEYYEFLQRMLPQFRLPAVREDAAERIQCLADKKIESTCKINIGEYL